jgi:hypothetical protein
VVHHPRVEEILVDGGQLILQELVQFGDDLWIAFHDEPPGKRMFALDTPRCASRNRIARD